MLGFGFPVESVSIVANADSLGRVIPGQAAPDGKRKAHLTPAQLAVIHQAAADVCMAGGAADAPGGFAAIGCESEEKDTDDIADWVWDRSGVPALRWRHVALAVAERYLRDNWTEVERVAAALFAERVLTSE